MRTWQPEDLVPAATEDDEAVASMMFVMQTINDHLYPFAARRPGPGSLSWTPILRLPLARQALT